MRTLGVSLVVTAVLFAIQMALLMWWDAWWCSLLVPGLSSVWAAWDSARIEIRRYRTAFATEPVFVLALCAMLWIPMFPWYLYIRERIREGSMPVNQAPAGPTDSVPGTR